MCRSKLSLMLASMLVLTSHTALAQFAQPQERDDAYSSAFAFGIGLDKVNFDENTESIGVTYFTGNFRFNFWSDERDEKRGRLKGYLEAELGYWSDDQLSPFRRDLLLGLNAIAVVPAGSADVFFGAGFGWHAFGDRIEIEDVDNLDDVTEPDKSAFGANMQFGVDINFTDNFALFGLGRYDILSGNVYDFQTKIIGGLRVKF